jgi:dipeptidyl aminopeptidase/acylaminoacyl peptidase
MVRTRSSVLVAVAFYAVFSVANSAGQTTPPDKNEQSLIEIKPIPQSTKHALTLQEIISIRKPAQPRLSPDGTQIAFIVEQAFLDRNNSRSALFVVKTDGKSGPVKLLEENGISQLRWSLDGKFINYVSSKAGASQVWRVPPEGGTPEQVTYVKKGVGAFAWSPDMTQIAYIVSIPVSESEKEKAKADGIVFDGSLSWFDVLNKAWIKKPQELWIYDILQRREEKITDSIQVGGIFGDLAWSPDARKISIAVVIPDQKSTVRATRHIGYISLVNHQYSPLVTLKGASFSISWAPDSKAIAFLSEGDIEGKPRRSWFSLFTASLSDQKIKQLTETSAGGIANHWWSHDGKSIFYERTIAGVASLYSVPSSGGEVRKITQSNDVLYSFSFDERQSRAACIRQNSMTPPDVAVFDMLDGIPRTLTTLNPEYKNIRLGEVSTLTWKNQKINDGRGYLIKPLDFSPGKRYPLLVILYGFTGAFISQAQGFTSYPAQVFAANGFAVLLWNPPAFSAGYPGYTEGNFAEGSLAEADGPLESVHNAVKTVVDMGIADPGKTGIMGWSYGSFVTDFTITHSQLFQVASSGEGGLYNPFGYVIGSQRFQESVMGGPPYGRAEKNWRQVSPALNAGNVNIPVLMEYVDKNVYALDFFTALKSQGKQVELVFYPDEGHIFSQPNHRLSSMSRNLDWFNFWLQNKEDPDPTKFEQYARWRAMRKELNGPSVTQSEKLRQ